LTITENLVRTIDPASAWPVLQQLLTKEQHLQCTKISISQAEKFAGQNAKRDGGKVKDGRAEMNDRLKAAGAVGYKSIQKLDVRRIKENGENTTDAD